MTVQANVLAGIKGSNSSAVEAGTRQRDISVGGPVLFTDGAGAGQVSKSLTRSVTQLQSANTDIDLTGSVVGDDGATLALAAVKAIAIVANAANPGNLTVSPAPSNGFAGPLPAAGVTIPPGGRMVVSRSDATGWPVTAGTGDLLRVASAATAGNYGFDLCVLGI